jgi:acyl-CoA-binding protein
MTLERQFNDEVNRISALPTEPPVPIPVRRQLWMHYKQAIHGDYAQSKVGNVDWGHYKKQGDIEIKQGGWGDLKGMSKEMAMEKYIELAKSIR